MECKIIFKRNPDGSINKNNIQEVKAPNGKRSFLFDNIKKISNTDLDALKIYAVTYTPEFKDWLRSNRDVDINQESTLNNLRNFLYGKRTPSIGNLLSNSLFKNNNTLKSVSVLEKISNSDSSLNKLAGKLIPYAKYNNVDIDIVNEVYEFKVANGSIRRATAVYKRSENRIKVFKDTQFSGRIENLLIHEILHSVTASQLRQDTQVNADFKKLYEYAKASIPNSQDIYALNTLDEFIVGIFTDESFVDLLKTIPPLNTIKEYKNLFEEIFDYVVSLFDVSPDSNLYKQAYAVATNVLDEFEQTSKFYEQQDQFLDENYFPSIETNKLKDLEQELVNGFLKDFNITTQEYESLKNDLNIDGYAASDIIEKFIAYEKGESIIPEVAYFAYVMLGKKNNKIKSNLKYLINKWDKYQERFNYHKEIINYYEGYVGDGKKWKNKIRDLVILDFLQENIIDHYLNPQEFKKNLDTSWTREDFPKWYDVVGQIEKFLSIVKNMFSIKSKQRLKEIGAGIAQEIISRNYDYYDYNLSKGQVQKYYNDTLNSDPFAKKIIETGLDLGLWATGSIVVRKEGSLFRTEEESLHDIDWTVEYKLQNKEVNRGILNQLKSINEKTKKYLPFVLTPVDQRDLIKGASNKAESLVQELDWYKDFVKKYPSFKIFNSFYDSKSENIFEKLTVQGVIDGEFYDSDGYHEEEITYLKKDPVTKRPFKVKETVVKKHEKGEYVKGTGYTIDFFVYLEANKDRAVNLFQVWQDIFVAKIHMGREKDFIDWKMFIPFIKSKDMFKYEGYRHINYTSSPFYALENTKDNIDIPVNKNKEKLSKFVGTDSSKENLDVIINDLSRRFNVPVKLISNPKFNASGKFADGTVYINVDKVTEETPWHEFAHPFIELVKKDNNILYNSLIEELKTNEYGKLLIQETKELYPELSEDEQLEEALVEMIARYSTNKIPSAISNDNTNKSLFEKVKRFINNLRINLSKIFNKQYNTNNSISADTTSIDYSDINISTLNGLNIKKMSDIMKNGTIDLSSIESKEKESRFVTQFNNKSNPQLNSYKKILDNLSSRFGIKYTIVNNPNANWAGRYLPDGTIEINEAYIEEYPDAPFHEFFHPFLDVIARDNKPLFDNLKKEIDSLLESKDVADAKLKSLLERITNDSSYVNEDGTLNELGYKEAITELVGAHALKAHNDAWVKELKSINPKWKPQAGESEKGPGMSESRQRRITPLITQLLNYVKNIIAKLRTGSNLPTIPSQLNPNMTLSDLGYLMGANTKPVRLDLTASQDMPIQYKKFDDANWINPNKYNNNNYSQAQKEFVTVYNKANYDLLDTDKKMIVKIEQLSDKKKSEKLIRKYDELELYRKRKDEKGREFVENRVSMLQDLKYLSNPQKSKEEFKAEEFSPGSVLAREMGTKLHAINESILKRLLELDVNVDYNLDKQDWADVTFDEIIKGDSFYKSYVDQIKKGTTPFVYEEKSYGESSPIFDENGDYIGEEQLTTVNKDSTRSFDEMIKSMLRIYHEVYNIQNSIDPTKKPLILMEMPLYDKQADEAGTTDFMVVFSDKSAAVYDHKFINYKYKMVSLDEYRKRPGNKRKSEQKLLNEIYDKRAKQGLGITRYSPTKDKPGNQFFYEIDDDYDTALFRWKQDAYDMQLSRYADMLKEIYGVKKMRQVRIIPNAVSYTRVKDEKSNTFKIDPNKSKLQFLMTGSGTHRLLKQIPSKKELTDDKYLNDFIQKLEAEKDKIKNQLDKKGWNNNSLLVEKYNQLSDAIIALKVDDGLMQVVYIIETLVDEAKAKLDPQVTPKYIKTINEDGIEVETLNPSYPTFNTVNELLNQIDLYSSFVGSAKQTIDKLSKKESKEEKEKYAEFLAALGDVTVAMDFVAKDLKQLSQELLIDVNEKEKFMTKQKLLSYTQQEDINVIERYFTHLSNVQHPLVNMFKQMLDQVTYNRFEAEKAMINKINEENNKLKEWAKSRGISIYDAYKMILNENKDLVSEFSADYYKDIKDHKEMLDINRKWFKDNMQRSAEQEKSFQKTKEKTIVYYKERYGNKWEDEFKKWLNKNDITYNNGMNDAWFYVESYQITPKNKEKYYDKKYKTILQNKPLKDFYDFYRKTNIELGSLVDFRIKPNFVARIHKDMIDSLVQNGLSGTKIGSNIIQSIKNSFKVQEGIDIINIKDEDKSIPVMFTDSINVEDKSIDLAKNMIIFSSYVNKYAGLKEMEGAALSMRRLVAETNLVKKVGKESGKYEFQTIRKDNKAILALFDSMINYYIYGETINSKFNNTGLDPTVTKVITKVADINAKKNIGFNVISAAAGHVGAWAQVNAIAKQYKYLTPESLKKARYDVGRFKASSYFAYEYFRVSGEELLEEKADEINANVLRNKYLRGGVFILQRKSDDIMDHTILLAMMENYSIDPETNKAQRIEVLKEKYKNDSKYGSTFKWPTISSMINIENNKNGKMINPFTNKEFGSKEFTSFRKKVQDVAKKVKGNMSSEDIASYKTTLVGQVVMQFKNWIPAMLRERVKEGRVDPSMEEFEVGSWNALYNVIKTGKLSAARDFTLSLLPFVNTKFAFTNEHPAFQKLYESWKEKYPEDYAELMNKYGYDPDSEDDAILADDIIKKEFVKEYTGRVKGLAKEVQMYMLFALIMLSLMWAAGGDDEEENPIIAGMIATLQRSMLEVGFFLPVFDYLSTAVILDQPQFEMFKMLNKSPIPSLNIVTDALSTIRNTVSESIDLMYGLDPFAKEYVDIFNMGDEPFSNPYSPEIKKDNAPIFKYTLDWFPGIKGITKTIGLYETTDKKDTLWDWLEGQVNTTTRR